MKSKTHSYMYYNYVINKHVIGDVFWEDFEKTIHQYINENSSKFCFFKTLVKCDVHYQKTSICVSGDKKSVRLYKFQNGLYFYYQFCVSKQIRDYIYHRTMLKGIKLVPSSIKNNLALTIFSYYNSMTLRCRLQQPRRILESKLLKHKKNQARMIK